MADQTHHRRLISDTFVSTLFTRMRNYPPPRLALQLHLWQLPGSHRRILSHEKPWGRGPIRSSTNCTIISDFSVRITCVHLQRKHQTRTRSSTSERAHPARTSRRETCVRACDSGFPPTCASTSTRQSKAPIEKPVTQPGQQYVKTKAVCELLQAVMAAAGLQQDTSTAFHRSCCPLSPNVRRKGEERAAIKPKSTKNKSKWLGSTISSFIPDSVPKSKLIQPNTDSNNSKTNSSYCINDRGLSQPRGVTSAPRDPSAQTKTSKPNQSVQRHGS